MLENLKKGLEKELLRQDFLVIKQKSLTKPGIIVGESKPEDLRFTFKTTITPSLSNKRKQLTKRNESVKKPNKVG